MCKLIIASTAPGEAKMIVNQVILALVKLLGCLATLQQPLLRLIKLVLASGKAISVVPGSQTMLSWVTHKKAKVKAHISSDATSPAIYKAKP